MGTSHALCQACEGESETGILHSCPPKCEEGAPQRCPTDKRLRDRAPPRCASSPDQSASRGSGSRCLWEANIPAERSDREELPIGQAPAFWGSRGQSQHPWPSLSHPQIRASITGQPAARSSPALSQLGGSLLSHQGYQVVIPLSWGREPGSEDESPAGWCRKMEWGFEQGTLTPSLHPLRLTQPPSPPSRGSSTGPWAQPLPLAGTGSRPSPPEMPPRLCFSAALYQSCPPSEGRAGG